MSKKGEGNPRAASVRFHALNGKSVYGQIAHDVRKGAGAKLAHVDYERSHMNRILMEIERVPEMRRIATERRALKKTQRRMKSNAAVATAGIITFGTEAAKAFDKLTPEQQDAAFRELAEAVAERMGTSLHGLLVHLDETQIHAHFYLSSYNKYGEPISQTTSPGMLSDIQTLTFEIMSKYAPEIERGYKYSERIAAGADYADTLHRSVRQLHRDLPAEIAAKEAAIAALAEAEIAAIEKLAKNERLVEKAVKDLAAAESDGAEKIAKIEKRLALYNGRVDTAKNEMEQIEAEKLAAAADIERMRGISIATITDEIRADPATVAPIRDAVRKEVRNDPDAIAKIRNDESSDLRADMRKAIRGSQKNIETVTNEVLAEMRRDPDIRAAAHDQIVSEYLNDPKLRVEAINVAIKNPSILSDVKRVLNDTIMEYRSLKSKFARGFERMQMAYKYLGKMPENEQRKWGLLQKSVSSVVKDEALKQTYEQAKKPEMRGPLGP